MTRFRPPVTLFLCALLCGTATSVARAQAPASAAHVQEPPAGALRVTVSCVACDLASLKAEMPFLTIVDAGEQDVAVIIARIVAPDWTTWTMALTGRGRFLGRDRTIAFSVPPSTSAADAAREVARRLKLGLAEFALQTPAGSALDVTIAPAPESASSTPARDPWNAWVYRLSVDSNGHGEQSTFNGYYELTTSANRTTANWKMRISAYNSLNESQFDVADDEQVTSRVSSWSVDSLFVKSLGRRLSAGFVAQVYHSSYSNERRAGKLMPGVEFDVFPYSESTKRSLTIQYTAGRAYREYEQLTIYDKLKETDTEHAVDVSLGLRQPWGQAGARLMFTQQITAPDRTRVSVLGNTSFRLTRSLSLNGSASFARIRDQFSLEKGEATEDEVLLRQRQLATGHRYTVSIGITFNFGALNNATVNPRFSN